MFFKKITLKYTNQQRDTTAGYCEILNMNLNIWFDILSKYIEDFCIIASVAVVLFAERLTETSFQFFSLRILPFLQLWLKLKSLFFQNCSVLFFLFLDLCQLPAMCYEWALFLKQKVVHCVLSFLLFFLSFFCYAQIEVAC